MAICSSSKPASVRIAGRDVKLHVDSTGRPYLEVSELALASGAIEVTGGEDGGIADYGRTRLIKNAG